jgi:hypothetical protein
MIVLKTENCSLGMTFKLKLGQTSYQKLQPSRILHREPCNKSLEQTPWCKVEPLLKIVYA